jgi:hypothetical protein
MQSYKLLLLFFTKNIPFKNLKSCPNKICQAWSKQIENGSNSVGRRIEGFFFFFVIKHFHLSGLRLKCEKFNGRQTTSDGKSSHCLWQGELKKKSILRMNPLR